MLGKVKNLEVEVINNSPKEPLEQIDLHQYAGILLENGQALVFGTDYQCFLFGEELYATDFYFLEEHTNLSKINEILETAFDTRVQKFLKEITIRVEV